MLCIFYFYIGGIFTNNANELTLKESNVIASAEAVDTYCAAISAVVPLDLMPGCKDPAGVMLPQKPLHYCKLITKLS